MIRKLSEAKTATEIMQDYVKMLRAIQLWSMQYPNGSLKTADYLDFIKTRMKVSDDEAVAIYKDYCKWTGTNTVEEEKTENTVTNDLDL